MSEQFLCFNVEKFYVCASVGTLLNNSTICTVQQQESNEFVYQFPSHPVEKEYNVGSSASSVALF